MIKQKKIIMKKYTLVEMTKNPFKVNDVIVLIDQYI